MLCDRGEATLMTETNWNGMQVVLSQPAKGSGKKPTRCRNADVKAKYMTAGSWHANLSNKGMWKR